MRMRACTLFKLVKTSTTSDELERKKESEPVLDVHRLRACVSICDVCLFVCLCVCMCLSVPEVLELKLRMSAEEEVSLSRMSVEEQRARGRKLIQEVSNTDIDYLL